MKLAVIIVILGIGPKCFAQDKAFSSIKEALEHHIEVLKSNVGRYDHVYIVSSLESTTILPSSVFQIENSINPKLLRKTDADFLVKLVFYPGKAGVKFEAVNYKVLKISNKKLKLTNLSNGGTYSISPDE